MIKALKDTTAQGVQNAITEARHNLGAATGLVFTLIVVTDLIEYHSVFEACQEAAVDHPSRIIIVTNGTAKADRLDAEVHLGEDAPGEMVALRFNGEIVHHRDSVILPLLLPDAPVIAWWPGNAPDSLIDDPIGRLASRRITDAKGADDPMAALTVRARHMTRGDTDLAWTRLTRWRALLASSLDRVPARVSAVSVTAETGNTAAALLAAWLEDRLACPVTLDWSRQAPGIGAVTMTTDAGDIRVSRVDGRMATFSAPNTPQRAVALRRRTISQLLASELRRLDNDEVQQSAMRMLAQRCERAEDA